MSRQYVVQFQLGTTRLLKFIDFLLAVERTQQIMDSTTLYQTVEIHRLSACSRENAANNGLYYTVLYSILLLKMADSPYISLLDDVTAQGLYCMKANKKPFVSIDSHNHNNSYTDQHTTVAGCLPLFSNSIAT